MAGLRSSGSTSTLLPPGKNNEFVVDMQGVLRSHILYSYIQTTTKVKIVQSKGIAELCNAGALCYIEIMIDKEKSVFC